MNVDRTAQYYINLKMDKVESNLKEDIGELKEMLRTHLQRCDTQMEEVDGRLQHLEAFKNKVIGTAIVVAALIGLVKLT